MLQRSVLISLPILFACSGDKGDDTADTQEEVQPIEFSLSFADGYTQAALVGAEVCLLEPDLGEDEGCNTTDAMGLIDWTWMEPVETNFLHRLTKPDYLTTLYLGRYDDALGEQWEETFEATGGTRPQGSMFLREREPSATSFLMSARRMSSTVPRRGTAPRARE